MRITVFGASGGVGSRVVTEAVSRGHHVTAVARDTTRLRHITADAGPGGAAPDVTVRAGDARDVADVLALSAGQDLVISATRPAPGSEPDLVTATKALLAGLAGSGVRLLVVGGAATLTVPGTGAAVIDDPRYLSPAYRPIALACSDQLAAYRTSAGVDWAYLSPPALLAPGIRTGTYRIGGDELLTDAGGRSAISMEDLAVALLDEAEQPRHHRARFTVAH